MDTDLENTSSAVHEQTPYEPKNTHIHLTIPEKAVYIVNDESPIDRYGPSLRRDTSSDFRLLRQSSCYSRNTDGDSVHDREDTKVQEDGTYENDEGISRPSPVHHPVLSGLYMTHHGNESRLIIQGLSDPYRNGISSVSGRYAPHEQGGGSISTEFETLRPGYPLRITRTPDSFPSPRTQDWQVRATTADLPRFNPRFTTPSVPPIRPERWSAVSPSFRTPASLVSPWKMPPSIVISNTPRLNQCSIDTNSPHRKSKRQRYLPKKEVILIILAVVLATFCITMDMLVISPVIPTITSQFNTIEDIGWYTSSYFLASSSSYLFHTKLYRLYTAKWIILASLLTFEVGLLFSGIAEVSAMLIFGRALAGWGASGFLAGFIYLMGQCVSLRQVSRYLVVLMGVVLVVGPALGGVLTQYASWRWCFFINLPCALSSCILLLFSSWNAPQITTAQTTFKEKLPFLDLEGTFLLIPSMFCLLLAMQWGGVKYPWSSVGVIILLAIFVVTNIGFILVQNYKGNSASIPSRLFMNRNVCGGMITSFCIGGSIAVLIYYLPLSFQTNKNASPSRSGAMLTPLVLSMAMAAIASSNLVNVVGCYAPFLIFASTMMSIGSGLLTTLNDSTVPMAWIGYQVIFGAGAGSGIHQTQLAIQSSFQKSQDVAAGTGMMIFAQMLGSAVAVGMAQSVFENKIVNSIQEAGLQGVSVRFILDTGATDIRNMLSEESLETILRLYTRALEEAFYVGVGLAAAAVIGALAMEHNRVRGRRRPVAFF